MMRNRMLKRPTRLGSQDRAERREKHTFQTYQDAVAYASNHSLRIVTDDTHSRGRTLNAVWPDGRPCVLSIQPEREQWT